jgi:acetyltransferase-like isoleucine patch superfamily enzyme
LDETQRALVKIWEEALGVRPVGIRDNFFDLGGHSLLAIRVFAEVKRTLATDLPLASFLRAPTIEELSALIARNGSSQGDAGHGVRANGSGPSVASVSEPPPEPKAATMMPAPGSGRPRVTRPYGTERPWRGATNRVLQELARMAPGAQTLRVKLHRARGVNIGENVWIGYNAVLETAHPELITIGDNASISVGVVIIAHFMETTGVTIEEDAFLGPGVIVLPSVVIGHGAVVSAGSVVSQSIPPMTVAQGNPAVPVAKLSVPLRPNEGTLEEFARGLSRVERTPD